MAKNPEPAPKPKKWRWFRRLLGLVIAVAIAIPLFTAGMVFATAQIDNRRPSDVIVVLGAAQFDGRPQPVLQARLDHAKRLYQDGVAKRIMTVGGKQKGDRYTEATAGRNALIAAGVPASAIISVGTGRDTYSSLVAAAKKMDAKGLCTATLVSDPWHLLRSQAMAKDLGMKPVTSPDQNSPTQGAAAITRYIVRETAARLYYAANQARTTKPLVTGCA
ncbi:MAG: YdcF family protein [Actinomycetes bacterium]